MLPAASSSARSSPHRRAHKSSKGSEVKGLKNRSNLNVHASDPHFAEHRNAIRKQ